MESRVDVFAEIRRDARVDGLSIREVSTYVCFWLPLFIPCTTLSVAFPEVLWPVKVG